MAVLLVYAAWAMQLFDLHYFLGTFVAAPLFKLGTLIFAPLVLLVLLKGPVIMASMRPWVWYPPFVVMLVATVASLPIAVDLGLAKKHLQHLVIYYALIVATSVYIKTPKLALPILAMLVWRFLWWVSWARMRSGDADHYDTGMIVPWHFTLGNEDGFGGLMVVGVATCFWFGMAQSSKKAKWLSFFLTACCVVGVVASFARGAFLCLVAVTFIIWLRSPRKMVTAGALVGAALIVVAASSILFAGSFFKEISSVFEEGTDSGTGLHRWSLWTAAVRVWLEYPVFGVGIGNFGAFASQYFRPGEIPMFENPGAFWGFNTHNAYFQILAELGIVGILAFAWITLDFFVKNRAMRKPQSVAVWNASGAGSKLDLRYVSYGLETAMLATLMVNMIYASFLEPWFMALWGTNRMLWAMTSPGGGEKMPQQNRRRTSHPVPARQMVARASLDGRLPNSPSA